MTARVFHQKLKELLNDIVEKEAFGKPLAYVYVIEFQKRGLPHCHILIILNYNSKPLSPDDYDKFVSAEIPDASKLPILHSLVTSHMIHGPCGEANKNSPCMKDNKCSKSSQNNSVSVHFNQLMGIQNTAAETMELQWKRIVLS